MRASRESLKAPVLRLELGRRLQVGFGEVGSGLRTRESGVVEVARAFSRRRARLEGPTHALKASVEAAKISFKQRMSLLGGSPNPKRGGICRYKA